MVTGYSRAQISLHWAVALLIIYQLVFGEDMSHAWRALRDNPETATSFGAWVHIIAGILVLILALWRLALRMTRGVPEAPEVESPLIRLAGSLTHGGLYLLMLALPITGLLAWYGGISALAPLHGELLKLLTIVLIGLHVLGALYHQFVRRDGLMDRMRRPQD